jgi:hypothetical protein
LIDTLLPKTAPSFTESDEVISIDPVTTEDPPDLQIPPTEMSDMTVAEAETLRLKAATALVDVNPARMASA